MLSHQQGRRRSHRRGHSSNQYGGKIAALQITYTWDKTQLVPKTGTIAVELANGSTAVIRDFNPREGTAGLKRRLRPYTGYSQTSLKAAQQAMNAHKTRLYEAASDEHFGQRLSEIATGDGQWTTFDGRTFTVSEDNVSVIMDLDAVNRPAGAQEAAKPNGDGVGVNPQGQRQTATA